MMKRGFLMGNKVTKRLGYSENVLIRSIREIRYIRMKLIC